MIHLIVWSKDRAAQLRLLLESIDRFMPHMCRVSIIHKCTSPEFSRGYAKLFTREQFNNVVIIPKIENNFFQDTNELINEKHSDNLVGFSTDDTVLFKPIPYSLSEGFPPHICTFSLRYGFNTLLQDHTQNRSQAPLTVYSEPPEWHGDVIEWNYDYYHPLCNYGYPFGLDMHIYNRELLQRLLKYEHYANSNQLETVLFNKKKDAPKIIRSFKHSIAVNIPENNISGITSHMGGSLEDNNRRYLGGEVIDLDDICGQTIIGSHQEIAYKWKQK